MRRTRSSIRLPYGPLDAHLRRVSLDFDRDVARCIGVHRTQVVRWRSQGWISHDAADAAAIALDTHPALIWPEWFDVEFERYTA